MTPPRTCRLVTLGCKVNQYETQLIREALEAGGYREAAAGAAADLCVVNTCTVTHDADSQARQLVRRLHRDQPAAAILVVGCYAVRDPAAVARLPGVARVVADRAELPAALAEVGGGPLPAAIRRFDGHQRAFVKVQDGCLLNCTFCIIPSVRPALRSRPPEAIAAEVRQLVEGGCREIVLTGIHLGHYGIDLSRGRPNAEWVRLWHLLDRLAELPGTFRLRLSSLEAAEVRDDLLRAVAGNPRVVPHFHVCLQSGSDAVLARMRRRYRAASFLERCRQIRQRFDLPALTTDVIVGFPGETEADFAATCRVAREAGFAQMHLFPYSPRQGTAAAALPDQVPPPVLAERRAHLTDLDSELRASYLKQLVGRRLEVLVEKAEGVGPGLVAGTACRKVTAVLPGHAGQKRQLVPVRAVAVDGDRLLARPETRVGLAVV